MGLREPDDAAVWRLDEERAIVVTTDFFTPVVDEAYDYGAIAAANSLSDVYAMGGKPFLALNIAALPDDLPEEISREIIRAHGGEIVAENRSAAGASLSDKPLGARFVVRVPGLFTPARSGMTTGRRPASDRLNEPIRDRA